MAGRQNFTGEQFTRLVSPGTTPIINSIFDLSAESLGQLKLWFEQNPPSIPISQVIGFGQFTASVAAVTTSEGTTSVTYTDLATVGPRISGLSDGKYVVVWASLATSNNNGLSEARMAVQANSGTPPSGDNTMYASTFTGTSTSIVMFDKFTLSGGGNNTLTAKYLSTNSGKTAQFTNRALLALRYANL